MKHTRKMPIKERACLEVIIKHNGNISNVDVAKNTGCSKRTVERARHAYNNRADLNSYKQDTAVAKCAKIIEQNPTMDDHMVASLAGCHYKTVQRVRNNTNVKPSQSDEASYDNHIDGDSWIHNADYYYDGHNDIYVVQISKSTKPLVIAGETMRGMRKDYSDIDGSHLNINEVCVKYSIPRAWFMELKTKMGWTHTDITFTDEEVKQKDVNTLVTEALENKKRAFINQYQRQHLDNIKADAKKWRDFEFGILKPWNDVIATPIEYAPTMLNVGIKASYYMLVVIADDHFGYGKDSYRVMNGRTYDIKTAIQRMNIVSETVLNDCKSLRLKIDKMFVLSMGDTHDSETDEATTNGTPRPQTETLESIWLASTKAHADLMLNLKRVANCVDRYNVVGNHSPFIDFALETFLKAKLSCINGININPNDKPAVSFVINDTQIVGHHGKGIAPTKSNFGSERELKGSLMFTNWFKDDFIKSKYHELFLAHVHHRVMSELSQYKLHIVPSIMGDDTYSDSLMVQSEPGAMYYLIDNNGIAFERFIKL